MRYGSNPMTMNINALFLVHFLVLFVSGNGICETLSLQKEKWTVIPFDKISPNQIQFQSEHMKVEVKSSAGPLVYKFEKPVQINKFSVKGIYTGTKKKEKTSFDEDSVLRFGLVVPGENRLSGPKKWLASKWIKELFNLAPPNMGVDRIQFYNISNRRELLNLKRLHPKSTLLSEFIAKILELPGPYSMEVQIQPPLVTAALWLSIDGDDSSSEFTNEITEISIH